MWLGCVRQYTLIIMEKDWNWTESGELDRNHARSLWKRSVKLSKETEKDEISGQRVNNQCQMAFSVDIYSGASTGITVWVSCTELHKRQIGQLLGFPLSWSSLAGRVLGSRKRSSLAYGNFQCVGKKMIILQSVLASHLKQLEGQFWCCGRKLQHS